MRVLLTGGAGFVGSHLAERLAEAGHEVVIYDVFSKLYAPAVKRRNVAPALAYSGCSLIEGDVLDEQRLESVVSARPFDAVCHLAGWCGSYVSLQHPHAFARNNVRGTLNVLERCRTNRVGRLVFASAAAVYGSRREGPLRETDPTDRPVSPYGVTKKSAEMWCHLYHHLYGLDVGVLRLFSVYGPRQRPDQSVHQFAKQAAAGEPIALRGDGTAVRDPVHVDDVVTALVAAFSLPAGFEVINVGSGTGRTMLDLARCVASAFGSDAEPVPGTDGPADPPVAFADVSKAERLLSWKPTVPFEDGLARFATWFRAQEFEDEA